MCLIAISMAVVAIDRAGAANTSAIDARIESNTRVAQALVLQTAQLAADQNAQAAESKAAEARTSAALEQVARATAEQASTKADSERATAVKALADVQKRQLESNANELAALAYGSRSKQPQVALLLAAASIQISLKQQSNPVPVAVDTLKTLLTSVTGKGYYQHTGPLTAVAVDAAGRKLVTAGSDGTALIWDPANFAATPTKLDAGNPIVFMGLSADGRYLVTAGTGGDTALLWDLNTPNARSALTLPGNIKALAISPSGRAIALASDSGSTWVWDPAQPSTPIHKLGDRNPALSVALSVDGRWALTGHQDGKARLWDLNGRDPISANFTNSRGYALTSVTFSPDGRWALFGGKSGEAQLWSFSSSGGLTSSAPTLLLGQTATISVIAVSPDSKLAATASDDGSTYVWSLRQGATTPFAVLRLQRGATKAVQFTSDSNRLVTAGASGALSVWDLKAADPGGSGRELIGHDASANAIAISGSLLASVSDDTSLRIWDLSKPAPTEDSLPNNPTDLVALACNVVGRDIQQSEWTSSSVPYQSVCAAK
jgi:WD40 repeat protein